MHCVFVYGSLMSGERNHHYLTEARLVAARGWTNGQLYDTSLGYPALLPSDFALTYGEVYEVSDIHLAALDDLEDFFGTGDERNEYERITTRITTEHGSLEAFVYFYRGPAPLTIIENGDWRSVSSSSVSTN